MTKEMTLMELLDENEKVDAAKIRFDKERLVFLNNQRQRRGLPRLFTLPENGEGN